MKKTLLPVALISALFLAACSEKTYYTAGEPSPPGSIVRQPSRLVVRDGHCYQNCLIPDRYEMNWVSYPVYTGSDAQAPTVTKVFTVTPAKSR